MKILGVIPARYASVRFPGKPLVDIMGHSMIERVYLQAKKAKSLADVVVATDDQSIFDHVKAFGGNVELTANTHKTGTDRCSEVIKKHPWNNYDVVINIQGDEPLINPEQINLLASLFKINNIQIGTLIKTLNKIENLDNPNVVKVTVGTQNRVTAFSRSPIPFVRGFDKDKWLEHHEFYEHIGIYGYKNDVLKTIANIKQSDNEKAESLEQLRWLDNNYKIFAAVSNHTSFSIDTPDDLEKLLDYMKTN